MFEQKTAIIIKICLFVFLLLPNEVICAERISNLTRDPFILTNKIKNYIHFSEPKAKPPLKLKVTGIVIIDEKNAMATVSVDNFRDIVVRTGMRVDVPNASFLVKKISRKGIYVILPNGERRFYGYE